jgi:hypothetical protein
MPTADTSNNIIITTYDATAVLGTDYATSGSGLSLAHLPLQKLVWGSDTQAFRASETYPLPVTIYGTTYNSLMGVTFSGITGSVFVSNRSGSFLVVGGPSGNLANYVSVPVTGYVQGATNGILLGITGEVNIKGIPRVQGTTGGIPIEITGGIPLSYTRDSVTVKGYVGISGGFGLAAGTDSVAVYGSDLGGKVLTKLYAGDGTTLGHSGDALNVNVVGAAISATVTINPVVGVTNGNGLALKVIGSGVTSDAPILVKGTVGSGALEVISYAALPVGVSGDVGIDDAAIIDSLESASKPIVSNLTSIKTNTAVISTINDKLAAGSVAVRISDITKPPKIISGQKDLTTVATLILSTSNTIKSGVHLKSPISNTTTIYVGGSSLLTSSTSGFPLEPGESVFIEIDNINKIYAVSTSDALEVQKINYIAS